MNGTEVMITILGGMLFVEILLTVWLGFYMAKVFRKIEVDAREMRDLLARKN